MTEAPTPRPSRSAWAWLAGWLLLGLGLRLAAALALRSTTTEWEADGFVRAWEGWTWGAWSRVRPPGWDWLLALLGRLAGPGDALGLRCACVALSLLALGCAWLLARAFVRRLGGPAGSDWRACTWLTAAWALWPTLVLAAPRPIPETSVAGAACLALAAVATVRPASWPARLVLLTAALSVFVLLGGLVAALAIAAGLLVFLLPLPRLPVALLAVVAVACALWLGCRVQAGPDTSRRWEPDGAPVHGLAALLVVNEDPSEWPVIDPDVRAAHWRAVTLERLRETGPVATARALLARLLRDQSGPERLLSVAAPGWAAALLDALLRGATLLLALAALRRVTPLRGHGAGRAAVAAGAGVWLVLGLAGASTPLALAPLDLVLAAAAAAGLAALPADARPRPAMLGAGALAAALAVVLAAARGREVSDWSRTLGHETRQGAALVSLLRDGGPGGAAAEVQAAMLLGSANAPFLRLPEAARRHAEAAVLAAPESGDALMALVRAYMENLDFPRARDLLGTLVDDQGQLQPGAAAALTTLGQLERRLRDEHLR